MRGSIRERTDLMSFTENAISFTEGEHPRLIVREICTRPKPNAHIIVFANEKGGVGKSTLAFHCCIALSDAGERVAAIDLDRRQRTLSTALAKRESTARLLQVELPCPPHAVPQVQSGAVLSQEIARIGSDCSFIVIDLAGHDSPIARRAIAMADTLVTPVNSSFVDLDLLGKFDPVTMRLKEPGNFARLITALREEQIRHGRTPLDWIVTKNRVRTAERRQQMQIDRALAQLAPNVGFRLGEGLGERVAYRELFPFGLTHLDLGRIPHLARMQARTGEEVVRLISDLALPKGKCAGTVSGNMKAKVVRESAEAFRTSLDQHMRERVPSAAQG